MFIDASQHFEKIKTQNQLRPQDIEKIVTTYRGRMAEDKYSYLAPLSEIAENDYNLNIPRYVDTFEAEAEIDLTEVTNRLRQIDKDMANTDKVIAGFCKELGIESPF